MAAPDMDSFVLNPETKDISLGYEWRDARNLYTKTLSKKLVDKISKDHPQEGFYEGVEIYLKESIPNYQVFFGITDIDDKGIWFWDGDGGIEDSRYRSYLIPWHLILQVIYYQAT